MSRKPLHLSEWVFYLRETKVSIVVPWHWPIWFYRWFKHRHEMIGFTPGFVRMFNPREDRDMVMFCVGPVVMSRIR